MLMKTIQAIVTAAGFLSSVHVCITIIVPNAVIHVEGRNKLLNQPEYDNAEDLRRIANK